MGIKVLGLLLALVAGVAYGRPGYGSISLGSGQGGVKGNAGFGYSGTKTPGSGARGHVDVSTNELGDAELHGGYGQHNGHGSSNQIAGVTGNSDLLGAVNGGLEGSNLVNGEAHSEPDASSAGGFSHGNRDNSVSAVINLGGYGANSNGSSGSHVAGHSGGSLLGDGDSHGFVGNDVREAVRVGHIHGTSGSNEEAVGVSHGSNSVLGALNLGGNAHEADNGASGNSVLGGVNVAHTNQGASGLNFGGNGNLNAHSYGRRYQSAGDTANNDLLSVVNGSLSSSTDGYHTDIDGEAASHGSNSVLGLHGSGSNVLTGISLGGYGANRNSSSETNANVDAGAGHSGGSNLLGDVSSAGHGDNGQSVGNDVQDAGHEDSQGSNSVLGLGLGGTTNGAANVEGGHGSSQSGNSVLGFNLGHNDHPSGVHFGGNGIQNSAGTSGAGYPGVSPYGSHVNGNGGLGTHSQHRYPSGSGYGSHTYPSTGGISTLDVTFPRGNVHPSNQTSGVHFGGNVNQNSSGTSGNNAVDAQEGSQGAAHLDLNRPHSIQGDYGSGYPGVSPYGNHVNGLSGSGTHNPSNSVIGTYVPVIHPSLNANGSHTYPSTGESNLNNTFASNGVSGDVHPSNYGTTGFSEVSHGNNSVLGLSLGGKTNGAVNGEITQGSTPSVNSIQGLNVGRNDQASGLHFGGNTNQNSSVPTGNIAVAAQEGIQGAAQFDSNRSYGSQRSYGTGYQVSPYGNHVHGNGGFGAHSQHSYPSNSAYSSHTYPSKGGISTSDNTFANNGISGNVNFPSGHSHGCFAHPISSSGRGSHGYGSSDHAYPAGQGEISGSFGNSPGFDSHGYGSSGNAFPAGQSGISNSPGFASHGYGSGSNAVPVGQDGISVSFGNAPGFDSHGYGSSGNAFPAGQSGISNSPGFASHGYGSGSNAVPVGQDGISVSFGNAPGFDSHGYGSSGNAFPAGQSGISNSPGFARNGYGSGRNVVPAGQGGISGSFGNSPGFDSHGYGFSGNAFPAGQGGIINSPGFASHGYGSGSNAVPAGQSGISSSFGNSPGFASHGYGSGSNAVPAGQGGISGSFSNSPGYGNRGYSFSGSVNAGHDE